MQKKEEIARDVLSKTVSLLRACGLSQDQIMDCVRHAVSQELTVSSMGAIDGSLLEHMAATDLVFMWRQDPRFTDQFGAPSPLRKSGADNSFENLTSIAAPNHEWQQVLKDLVSLGAVGIENDDTVKLITESVLLCSGVNGGAISPVALLQHVEGFLGSVSFNVIKKSDNTQGRFERACYGWLPADLVPIFERMVEDRGQNFVDGVDEWLVRHRSSASGHQRSPSRLVGVGAYVVVRRSNNN